MQDIRQRNEERKARWERDIVDGGNDDAIEIATEDAPEAYADVDTLLAERGKIVNLVSEYHHNILEGLEPDIAASSAMEGICAVIDDGAGKPSLVDTLLEAMERIDQVVNPASWPYTIERLGEMVMDVRKIIKGVTNADR